MSDIISARSTTVYFLFCLPLPKESYNRLHSTWMVQRVIGLVLLHVKLRLAAYSSFSLALKAYNLVNVYFRCWIGVALELCSYIHHRESILFSKNIEPLPPASYPLQSWRRSWDGFSALLILSPMPDDDSSCVKRCALLSPVRTYWQAGWKVKPFWWIHILIMIS